MSIAAVKQQYQIQNFWSLKPLIYRSIQALLRRLDRLKRRRYILNLELLAVKRKAIFTPPEPTPQTGQPFPEPPIPEPFPQPEPPFLEPTPMPTPPVLV